MSLEFVRLTIGQHITRGMTNTAVCANSFGWEEGATHVYLVLGRGGGCQTALKYWFAQRSYELIW